MESPSTHMADQLIIRGAREHNLKDVSLDLPRDALIVFTGLSGSGKSSLAFDTIFAEGQRRYVESLSAYARQFLGQMDKPDVDFIEGLSPAVIDRPEVDLEEPPLHRRHHHRGLRLPPPALRPRRPRRTARPAARRSSGRPRSRSSTGCSPSRRAPASRCSRRSSAAARASTSSCSASCSSRASAGPGSTARPTPSTSPRSDARQAEEAHHRGRRRPPRGQGLVQAPPHRLGRDRARSRRRARGWSTSSTSTTKDPEPRDEVLREDVVPQRPHHRHRRPRAPLVLLQLPVRRLPACSGLGTKMEVDPELVVPDPGATLGEGAIQPWSGAHVADYFLRLVNALGEELGFDLNTPWDELRAAGPHVAARGPQDQGPRRHPQPLRPRARLLRRVRGRPPLRRAPAPRGGVRHQPRPLRGLHARGALPGLPRHPAQARVGGGHPRRQGRGRQEHRRGLRAADQRGRRLPRAPSTCRCARAPDRRAGAQGDPGAAAASCSTSASTTSPSTGPAGRCRAARRSGSGWPPRSAPGSSASSTSSTSRRSACTSATTSG